MNVITPKYTQRGNGWQAELWRGKGGRKTLPTKEEAMQWAERTLAELEANREITMQELINITWDHVWHTNRTGKESVRLATHILEDLGWASKEVSSMTKRDLEALRTFYREKGNTGATLNRKLAHINKMLSVAVDLEYVESAPRLKQQKEEGGRERVLSKKEEAAMLSQFEQHEYYKAASLFAFLLDTGCRVSEALDIEPCDVTHDTSTDTPISVLVGNYKDKNGKKRKRAIPLTKRAAENLLKWQGLQQRAFNKQWDNVAQAIGITGKDREEFVPHMLRHTCATRLAERGADLRDIKEWLGHKTIEMTMRYAKFQPSRLLGLRDTLQ